MTIADLTAYASSKYHIEEEHKWNDFPGFSVLVNPFTGKWAALLMRKWDQNTGSEIEICDIRCGAQVLKEIRETYLVPPFRMHGSKWVGVRFSSVTDPAVVCSLFDRAVNLEKQRGFTIVLDSQEKNHDYPYRETKLPPREAGDRRVQTSKPLQRRIHEYLADALFAGAPSDREREAAVPGMIRKMRELYSPGDGSIRQRSLNFYIQGKYMKDYEDNAPWTGNLRLFFPSYHDLNTQQLRGYFTWRAGARKGIYAKTCESYAYIFIYELLNGIGADSAEKSLDILERFMEGAGWLEAEMRENVQRWMLDFSILNGLPAETARRYMNPAIVEMDGALSVLMHPENRTDREVVSALNLLSGNKPDAMPAVQQNGEEGIHLVAEVWRCALSGCREEGQDLFMLCFGRMYSFRWSPMRNALYWPKTKPDTAEYRLDDCRLFFFDGSEWMERCYRKLYFDQDFMEGLFHETDRKLRQYLKIGRALRKRQKEAWAEPYIDAVIEADRKAKEEAARPKVEIDFSGLDRIRQDSAITRDSLLVEEPGEGKAVIIPSDGSAAPVMREKKMENDSAPDVRGNEKESGSSHPAQESSGRQEEQIPAAERILRALLNGDAVEEMVRMHYLMPSIAADEINEACYEMIGDNVVDCDGDRLFLIDDYIEELKALLDIRQSPWC